MGYKPTFVGVIRNQWGSDRRLPMMRSKPDPTHVIAELSNYSGVGEDGIVYPENSTARREFDELRAGFRVASGSRRLTCVSVGFAIDDHGEARVHRCAQT